MTPSTDVVLVARDVRVVFTVFEDAVPALKHRFAERRFRRTKRKIHAVQGVDLVVHEGESIGLIGANGSGKSTLLAALCGLIPLQSGEVFVRSRPTLLGVGAALRPQLSGRLNILIGGLALGMRRREIEDRIDGLIEFSGLRDSIDLPMRTYSSGMRARLVFTIATAVTPDILMIDEALAVGDAEFKARSEERVREIRKESGAVLLVSHNLDEIARTCDRAIWLDRGLVRASGAVADVIAAYRADLRQPHHEPNPAADKQPDERSPASESRPSGSKDVVFPYR